MQDHPTPDCQTPDVRAAGWFRWIICLLPFTAIVLIYIDRVVLAVLKPTLARQFHWTDLQYAHVTMTFQIAYATGLVLAGYFIDRVGIRIGFFIAALLWSLIDASHGFLGYLPVVGAASVLAFSAGRLGLGICEGAFFPASMKVVSEWFPKRDRALATGIFNAGSNIGAIVAPLMVPVIALHWGWPAAFFFIGGLGLIWVMAWAVIYRDPGRHRSISAAELAYIRHDLDAPPVKIPPQQALEVGVRSNATPLPAKVPWIRVLGFRQTWSFMIGKFMTDPIWWLYLSWTPDFLSRQYGLNLKNFGPPLLLIYVMADIGSIAGGWLSSTLIHRGWTVNQGRKTAMLVCALCVIPIIGAAHARHLWMATAIIGLAAAAHQGWSANIFTMASDTAPRAAVSSIVGLGGMAGGIGAMLFSDFIGHRLTTTHGNYLIPFCVAASAYLTALLIIHLLNPRLDPIQIPEPLPATIADA